MPVTYSPLRYPGGKTQLASFVEQLIRQNNLLGGTYVEPFAGGAGIAWQLLRKNVVNTVVINDLSKSIYSFWHTVVYQSDVLCGLIENTPVTIDQWYEQREVQSNQDASILDLGFSTLFLNRVNRSGILHAGVIGGKDQAGKYRLDCRFNKTKLIEKIQWIALQADRITLTNMDGTHFLSELVPTFEERTLINIDPPYYNKGKELYQNFFEHDDHAALFAEIRAVNRPWMVTYDNTKEIVDIYEGFNPKEFSLNYSAQVKRRGKEIIVLSPQLEDSSCLNQLAA